MKEHEKWFKKAENDLIAVKNLIILSDAPVDICCFHSQQAAEKYLKAYLVAYNIKFPNIHDLLMLMLLCKQKNVLFAEIEKLCISLTDYGVTPRYPDEVDDLTLEDAQQAYKNAIAIKTFVLKNFFE